MFNKLSNDIHLDRICTCGSCGIIGISKIDFLLIWKQIDIWGLLDFNTFKTSLAYYYLINKHQKRACKEIVGNTKCRLYKTASKMLIISSANALRCSLEYYLPIRHDVCSR